jgi:hypothetical protein
MSSSKHKQTIQLIKSLAGQSNVLTIPRVFIAITGEINAALLLSQCIYWSDKSNNEFGYFYKSYREWQEEIGLTQYQVSRAAAKLAGMKVLKVIRRKAHGAPTLHYKIDFEMLTNLIMKKLDNQETSQSDYEETQQSDYQETSQSLTETTHKTTQKSTEGAAKPPTPRTDPRSKLPAIQCVKGITNKYPPKELYDPVIAALGETPDGELLLKCRQEWVARGYNPSSWVWLLEWYPQGIPGKNGGGKKPAKTGETWDDVLRELREEA